MGGLPENVRRSVFFIYLILKMKTGCCWFRWHPSPVIQQITFTGIMLRNPRGLLTRPLYLTLSTSGRGGVVKSNPSENLGRFRWYKNIRGIIQIKLTTSGRAFVCLYRACIRVGSVLLLEGQQGACLLYFPSPGGLVFLCAWVPKEFQEALVSLLCLGTSGKAPFFCCT